MASNTRGAKRCRLERLVATKERQMAALRNYLTQKPPDLRMENGWLKARNAWLEERIRALSVTVEAGELEQERLEQRNAAAPRECARESPPTLQPAPAQQQAPEHQQDFTSRMDQAN
jgi:hypothetical protein